MILSPTRFGFEGKSLWRAFGRIKGFESKVVIFYDPIYNTIGVSKEKACGELDETIKNRDHELEFRRKKLVASWTRQSKIVKKGRIDINAELKEGMITKAISSMDFCRQFSASETPNQEKEFYPSAMGGLTTMIGGKRKLPTEKRKQDSINGDFVMCVSFYVHQLAA